MSKLDIINTTNAVLPRAAFSVFQEIADKAFGKNYSLTVAIVGPTRIKKLNLIYRNKNKPTDILSFPLSKTEGEIYLCPSEMRREAKKFDRSYDNFIPFLFIHGCVHLKGYDHGSIMESVEAGLRKKFNI
jgi:probable rRNA maturation factor